jgi:hypothetical protein
MDEKEQFEKEQFEKWQKMFEEPIEIPEEPVNQSRAVRNLERTLESLGKAMARYYKYFEKNKNNIKPREAFFLSGLLNQYAEELALGAKKLRDAIESEPTPKKWPPEGDES